MQTVFADWVARAATLPSDSGSESREDEWYEGEGISARGLEILRVLNDVFNTLPGDVEERRA
jgi:hypothetical protein